MCIAWPIALPGRLMDGRQRGTLHGSYPGQRSISGEIDTRAPTNWRQQAIGSNGDSIGCDSYQPKKGQYTWQYNALYRALFNTNIN